MKVRKDFEGNGSLTIQAVNGASLLLEVQAVEPIHIITNVDSYTLTPKIVEVNFKDELIYKIGDSVDLTIIPLKPYTFIINEIFQISPTLFLINTDKRNKCTYYITPTIFNNKYEVGITNYRTGRLAGYLNCNFINSYINLESDGSIKHLILKYLFTNDEAYLQLEKQLEFHPNFVARIDRGQYVYFKFIIPLKYIKDVSYILNGEYSKIKTSLKGYIVGFMSNGDDDLKTDSNNIKLNKIDKLLSPLAQGLFKHETLRAKLSEQLGMDIPVDYELVSKPILENEFIDLTL